MKLRTWWKFAVFKYDIKSIEDTCVEYLKYVTFWHPDYQEYKSVVCHVKNIE